jgi:hypothetical protein
MIPREGIVFQEARIAFGGGRIVIRDEGMEDARAYLRAASRIKVGVSRKAGGTGAMRGSTA